MKNNTLLSLFIIIVIAIIILVLRFMVTYQTKGETITVGTLYQQSGGGADWGEQAEKGIKLAVEKINTEGGIHNKKLQIIYEDSKSNAKDAVTAMNKLITINKIKIIFSQQSPVVVALSPIANNNKIILIDTGATTPIYISPNDFTFRVSYSASYFAKEISSILNEDNVKSAGILYVNNDYGIGMLNSYKQYFNGEVYSENFLQEDTDFRTQIEKIKSKNPEVIVYVSDPQQAGNILKQIKELNLNKPIYTDIYSIEYQSILDIAEDAAENVIYVSQDYDVTRNNVAVEFNEMYLKKYNEQSNPLSAQAYDGLMLIAYVMNQCENPQNTECIKNKLYEIKDFQGVIGKITFDINGDVIKRPTMLKTIKNGEFVQYEK